ncbi:MAG: MFS transporter [Bryobacteraceae bacterium]
MPVPQHFITGALAGLGEIRSSPVLLALAARAAMIFFFFGLIGPLYVLYAVRDLQFSPLLLGFVIAAGGVANLAGAYFAAAVSKFAGLRTAMVGSSICVALAIAVIALPEGPGMLALTAFVVQQVFGDSASVVYNVNEITLRQRITPEALLGRVNASMQLLTRGIYPIGALMSGMIAEQIGIRATMGVAAAGILVSTALLLPVQQWPDELTN